jgi:hypothetical protein
MEPPSATGLKFDLFRLFTREFVLLRGLKFVRFRGSRVFTRPKRPNFRPVPNSSGIPCKRGLTPVIFASHELWISIQFNRSPRVSV